MRTFTTSDERESASTLNIYSTSTSVGEGEYDDEKPTSKRDSIKDQIVTKRKPASRFASYGKGRSISSNENVNELARRRRLRYFSRRRL